MFSLVTNALGTDSSFICMVSAFIYTNFTPILALLRPSALAVMSTNPADVGSASLEGLGQDEIDTLNQWIAKFESKYPVVGNLTTAKN